MSQLKLFTFRNQDGPVDYQKTRKGIDRLRDTIKTCFKDLRSCPSDELDECTSIWFVKLLEDISEFEESLNGGSGVVDVLTLMLEEVLSSPDSLLRARTERVVEELKSRPIGARLSDKDLHNIIAVLP